MGLHLDLEQIWMKNQERQGPDVLRKYGCIINTGDNMSSQMVKKLREKNKKLFGLSSTFVANLHLPKAKVKEWLKVLTIDQIMNDRSNFSTSEKVHHLSILITALTRKLSKLERLQQLANRYKPCNVGIIVRQCIGQSLNDIQYEYVESVIIGSGNGTSDMLPKNQLKGKSKSAGTSRA